LLTTVNVIHDQKSFKKQITTKSLLVLKPDN
jgi:hypothetical protein